jgi:hypothetical protein
MFYDSLLLLSALLIATAIALLVTRGSLHTHNPFFRTTLFLICFSFYAWLCFPKTHITLNQAANRS